MFPLKFLPFFVASVIVSFFWYYVTIMHFFDFHKDWLFSNIQDMQTYDYVIVGAGSAGSILAARLAEKKYNVLLVEAGGKAPPFLDIPLITPLLQRTPYDWQYITVPQHNACQALHDKSSMWPAGKILGGTSRLNYMTYIRGHPLDYDGWFPDFVEYSPDTKGSMKVSEMKWHTDLVNVFLNAIKEVSEEITNINVKSNTGFMKTQVNMDNGRRWSTDEILKNDLPHLSILMHAYVQKVLVHSNKAVGIEFMKLGKSFKAFAKKGVIVSAGAIGSPKLLLLSGIGPKTDLHKLKIEVVTDLPVGQHLIDHILTGIDLIKLNTNISMSIMHALNPLAAFNYFFHGQGPWTSAGMEATGTFYSSLTKNKSTAPDLQLMVLPAGLAQDNGIFLKKAMGIPDQVYNKYFAPLIFESTATIAPVLLHPKSYGQVKLRSADPLDAPMIDPKYLSNPEDIQTLIAGIQFIKELLKTSALKGIGASLNDKKFPGCEKYVFDTPVYWECYIQHFTLTSYHPAGTCRMGDVVDSAFRVYNVTNLYVVDASVLPQLPSGNIHAAVVMLAEKAVHSLIQSWQTNKQKRNLCVESKKVLIFKNGINHSIQALKVLKPLLMETSYIYTSSDYTKCDQSSLVNLLLHTSPTYHYATDCPNFNKVF